MADLDQVLRAVAGGKVIRPGTGYNAPHMLDGEDVSMSVRSLAHHELVDQFMSGPPAITPLGEQLLAEFPAGQRFRLPPYQPAIGRAGRIHAEHSATTRREFYVSYKRRGGPTRSERQPGH